METVSDISAYSSTVGLEAFQADGHNIKFVDFFKYLHRRIIFFLKQQECKQNFAIPTTLGANFKKSFLFQASYTEYSAISMINGGHFEFWRPSWILKRC